MSDPWCPRCNAGPGRCSCPWWGVEKILLVSIENLRKNNMVEQEC